jgi:predicted nucleic acid-binding protein
MPVTYTATPASCPTNFSHVVTQGDDSALPVTIQFSSNTITIYSANYSAPAQTYTVKIVTTELNNSLTNTVTFTVTINKCATSIAPTTAFTSKSYTLGSVAITVPVTYTPTPGTCPTNFSYVVTQNDDSALPSAISFASNMITIYSATYVPTGTYTIKIVTTDSINAKTDT